jgi:hypothetical protein
MSLCLLRIWHFIKFKEEIKKHRKGAVISETIMKIAVPSASWNHSASVTIIISASP